jgi:trans-aconitate 2-methyltransferase
MDWNSEQYLKFETERTQPAIDLVNRINIVASRKILDIGCGPGNSTQVLYSRYPDA